MDKSFNYLKPWILQRADPYVVKYGKWYYFTASVPDYDRIVLRRSRTLEGLADAEEKTLWTCHESVPGEYITLGDGLSNPIIERPRRVFHSRG